MVAGLVVACEARTWLGTPFMHQGRMKGAGVDCAGLVLGVAKALDLVASDVEVTGYPRSPDGCNLLAACDRLMDRIPLLALAPGDVLVLRYDRWPQHLAIVGDYLHGGLSLIHALGTPDGKGSVVEHRLAPERLAMAVQAYRIPGVA